jgi:hypothetical protein
VSDEAEDLRHETPPRKPKSEYALGPIIDNVAEAVDKGWLGSYSDEVSVLLFELRTRLQREQESAVIAALERLRPKPEGLAYADPAGHFECNPAGSSFTGEGLSILELRVLAAHLATALDTVNDELNKRRAFGR